MLCPPSRMPTSLSMQQPTHQKYVSIACQGLHSLLDSGSSGVVQPDHGGSNHGSLIHDLGMNTNSSVLTQLSWTPKHICLPSWASPHSALDVDNAEFVTQSQERGCAAEGCPCSQGASAAPHTCPQLWLIYSSTFVTVVAVESLWAVYSNAWLPFLELLWED